jgi:hypothetical protein
VLLAQSDGFIFKNIPFYISVQLAIIFSVQTRAYYMIAGWSEKLFRYHSQDNNSTNTTVSKTIKQYVRYKNAI